MPLHRLSAITTDGAQAMSSTNGFIALCKKDKSFLKHMPHHCYLPGSIFVAPLQHGPFKALLKDVGNNLIYLAHISTMAEQRYNSCMVLKPD
jgi:hypothetical protein